jgi:AcrR family transcriptional regulator
VTNRSTKKKPAAISLHATLRDEAKVAFRAALLDAAELVFARSGFHGARIQDIAAEAKVSVGTVYNHFADKDEILVALMQARLGEGLAALSPRPDDPKEFEERFRARIRRIHRSLSSHVAFFAVACDQGVLGAPPADALRHPALRREENKLNDQMRLLLTEGIAEGALRDEDPVLLERFLGGALRDVGLHAARSGADTERAFEAVMDLFLRAARRTPEGTK